ILLMWLMLLQRGASVNGRDGAGRTALSHACERGFLDAVKVLVRHNADPEIGDSRGNTALMYAAAAGHSAVVEFLVRAFKRLGLQVDRQNQAGNSAAGVAKVLGHTECFSALTQSSKRGREAGGTPRPTLEKESERKMGHLVNKLELLQTRDRAQCNLASFFFLTLRSQNVPVSKYFAFTSKQKETRRRSGLIYRPPSEQPGNQERTPIKPSAI
uniref:Uncharacterized protein n=1 Tax=Salarias fasciatus TaxID=181472 RepID=A0A672H2T2_SALFA